MRTLALVHNEEHVCCRYRITAFRPALQQAGHQIDIAPWPRGMIGQLRTIRRCHGYDVVIVQRKLISGWVLSRLRKAARHLIFDFDDAVFLRDSYATEGLHDPKKHRRFTATLSSCDTVIAGNDYLARHAELSAPQARTTIIPTCIVPELYPMAQHDRPSPKAQLVWVGSSSTLQGIEQIKPWLEGIGTSCPSISLKLICDRALTLESLPVQFTHWNMATEAREIAAADIGIAWVPDDDWSRGKCGLKVLQYMAAGLPVVACSVGVHPEMVRHGDNGFIADTPDEWIAAVRCLAADPGLRQRMGQVGRKIVEEQYSTQVGARLWVRVLEQIGTELSQAG